MNKRVVFIIILITLIICWAMYYYIPDTSDKVWNIAKELYQLQLEKQHCKDNLSFLQTLEDYNGVNDECNKNDSLIEKKKLELWAAYEFEYMRTDMIISEMLMSKDIEKVEEVINSTWENETWTAFNTLMAILEEPWTPKKVE